MAPIEPLLAALHARGAEVAARRADLTDPRAAGELFDYAEATLGPVDVLINAAAFCTADTLLPAQLLALGSTSASGARQRPLDAAIFDQHFAVNARAVALSMAEFAARVAARGAGWGRIINVSNDGADCMPGQISYGASKHALESLSRGAAVELGPLGTTVNVVSLGMVQTGWITEEMAERAAREYPLRRIGAPEDVADVIVFLASRQARWITGQLLYVGGGHAMPR